MVGLVCERTGLPSTVAAWLQQHPALGSVWKVGSGLEQCLLWGLLGQVVEHNSPSVNSQEVRNPRDVDFI